MDDRMVGVQVAVVECVVGVAGQVDHDESGVVRGVEDVDVHEGAVHDAGS